jgi:hypothetical protein
VWSVLVSGPETEGVTMATIYLSIPLVTHWERSWGRGEIITLFT